MNPRQGTEDEQLREWRERSRTLYRQTDSQVLLRNWNRVAVYKRSMEGPELQQFLQEPDRFISAGRMIKDGDSTTVVSIRLDGREYIAKRYNIMGWRHGLSRLPRPSRAWRCWYNAHMLLALGFDTAAPCLMLERRVLGLRRHAWFLTEPVAGEDALHLLRKEAVDGPHWRLAQQQFRRLFQMMQRYQIVHGDLKATNFICTPEALVVLDLDGMRRTGSRIRFERGFRRDLRRFLKNWQYDAEALGKAEALVYEFVDEPL